ncbi:MAG: phosphodiester glycosidase family protein [Candidatus Marinimicrobia bacterium]|jgi:exopolysaccharide biosynthesis protein|nr:phosphodiester glycosidase family protein [Candidatus Neomarinimicrobiota bacterium]MBT3618183.1 phosphodiester glycosidase family protein [Candidatus Neomarinimicrobiota bacterium]MBT3828654.1 phosphodiester glycosidase family protein [Candidatus Neomarinimicrobiota bacterium]MBT3996884.1 phosphodiester glycosidase family protein [Candidatus Neomarinimicrobiota bacterium]MBT4280848.1 phosphodiester glycosidase family protein [Candidatus Neomarinimicrobiota bacterium]
MKLVFLLLLFLISCRESISYTHIPLSWIQEERKTQPGLTVYSGKNKNIPLKVWYAKIERPDSLYHVRALVSSDNDKRETPTQFLNRTGADLVINAGYFRMDKNPTTHVGFLYLSNEMFERPFSTLLRWNRRYRTARGAFGITESGEGEITWSYTRNDSLFRWENATPNEPNHPVKSLDFSAAKYWPVQDAIQAGPVLIKDGEINITSDEELFFNTTIPGVHPRSAVGIDENGSIIFCVVDGRQLESRGVDLNELAIIMKDIGCVDALNLDGGGSSAMVVGGKLINRPIGLVTEREVMSAFGVFSRE